MGGALLALVVLASCSGGQPGSPALPAAPGAGGPKATSQGPAATIIEVPIPGNIGGSQGGLALAPDGTVYVSTGGGTYVGASYANGTFAGILLTNPTEEQFATGPLGVSSRGTAFFAIDGNLPGSATVRGGVQSYAPGATTVTYSTFSLYGASVDVGAMRGDAFGNVWLGLNTNCNIGSCLGKLPTNDPGNLQSVVTGPYPLSVYGIAPLLDGSAWIALSNGTLQHYSASLTLLKTVTLPAGMQADGLIAKPDGTLWWTDTNANAVGEYANGSAHEFSVPTAGSGLAGITLGGDGAVWFTERIASKIGRIDSTGSIAEYATPTPNAEPEDIAGPSGAGCSPKVIYFAEAGVSKIGKIVLK